MKNGRGTNTGHPCSETQTQEHFWQANQSSQAASRELSRVVLASNSCSPTQMCCCHAAVNPTLEYPNSYWCRSRSLGSQRSWLCTALPLHFSYSELPEDLFCSSATQPALTFGASNPFRPLNILKGGGGFESFFGLCYHPLAEFLQVLFKKQPWRRVWRNNITEYGFLPKYYQQLALPMRRLEIPFWEDQFSPANNFQTTSSTHKIQGTSFWGRMFCL